MVVCESNYAIPKWCEWVDSHKDFTRLVSDYLCIKRIEKVKGRTLPTIARMLMRDSNELIPEVWGRIAFMDVVQKCLRDGGRVKGRPSIDDIQTGWRGVLAVAKVLQPKIILVSGANCVLDVCPDMQCACSVCCPILDEHSHGRIGTIPVLFIPHPMSRGFSYIEWRKMLRSAIPNVFV